MYRASRDMTNILETAMHFGARDASDTHFRSRREKHKST